MYSSLAHTKKKLISMGYEISDPWDIVDIFEKMIADYAGSKYAVSVDNCTNAIFLCLKYLKPKENSIEIPSNTYVSVPQAIIHAGYKPAFKDIEWNGSYPLGKTKIIDSATRFTMNMYVPNSFTCLSFHLKKILNIGKGGMILTDSFEAYEWFKKARYEGRDMKKLYDQDTIDMLGWNMYMPPEQACYGIEILLSLPENNQDCGGSWKYPDVRNYKCFDDLQEKGMTCL